MLGPENDKEAGAAVELSPRVIGKLRQFHRVLISYLDFEQAHHISSHMLQINVHERYQENQIVLQALNCAMIVAYCRPFSGNDPFKDRKIPDLPGRFLKIFTEEERKLHEVVMSDRNTVLAHSDSSAWEIEPVVVRLRGRGLLFPQHKDVRAPLTKERTVLFNGMCGKLMEAIFEERVRLEQEGAEYLRVLELDDEEFESKFDPNR
jgi:hypothetical protein